MQEIKTIIIDCDGVLTDGKVMYHSQGTRAKQFHSRDITSIKRLIAAGFNIYIVSKSSWEGLKHFAKRCGCKYVTGVKNKVEWAKRILNGQPFIAVCDDYDDLELCMLAESVFVPVDASRLLTDALSEKGYGMLCNYNGGSGVMEMVERLINPKCNA